MKLLFFCSYYVLCYVILINAHLCLVACLFVYFLHYCVFLQKFPVIYMWPYIVPVHDVINCIYTVLSL
jgi:hypothetical protein